MVFLKRLPAANHGAMVRNMKRPPLTSTPNRHVIARGRRTARDQADASAWLGENRGRAQIKPPPSAGRAASKLIKPLAKQFSGPSVSELDQHWPEIVGPQLAQFTKPEKFQGGAAGSSLVIRARGPAAALVEAQSAQILSRVANYSGKQPKRLKIVQGPLTETVTKAKPHPNRVTKVEKFTRQHDTLDATLEAWRKAIEKREGVHLPPHVPVKPVSKD